MNNLKKFLKESGYKFYQSYDKDNLCDWYACKRTKSKRECACNQKPVQVVVTPFIINNAEKRESVEIDITAEYNGHWWKMEAYGLSPEEVINKLNEIESALIRAWEAL